eukprot:scaffold3159_cov393-Prasinococcus_capsulatus_cf.AAC.4
MLACNAQYFAGNCLRYSQSGCDMVSVTFPCPGCMAVPRKWGEILDIRRATTAPPLRLVVGGTLAAGPL